MRNKTTMIHGFTCFYGHLVYHQEVYSVFGVAGLGMIVKWMWWNVNRLWYICKSLSVLFGVKSVNLVLGISEN